MKIGVFDSGVGGLTVLNKLVSNYPNNEYIYFGDIKNNPYGSKSVEELEKLSSNIIDFLIKKNVDMIIIACGTVSSTLGDVLKQKYNVPIIDIISPVIEYINNSNYNKIGIIATERTVNSNAFKNINRDTKLVACKQFVPIIEKNNYEELEEYLDLYLKDLKDRDLIVLGCTHYPIIKNKIKKYLGNNVKLLDMSECLPSISNEGNKIIKLYFSYLDDIVINNVKNIFKQNNYTIEKNDL